MNKDALSRDALTRWAGDHRESFEELLKAFVEVPSVSSDPEKKAAIREMAALATRTIVEHGGVAEIFKTAGNPTCNGLWGYDRALSPVTVSNHLDVQPGVGE